MARKPFVNDLRIAGFQAVTERHIRFPTLSQSLVSRVLVVITICHLLALGLLRGYFNPIPYGSGQQCAPGLNRWLFELVFEFAHACDKLNAQFF